VPTELLSSRHTEIGALAKVEVAALHDRKLVPKHRNDR
jgi:hypothetical protein